MSLVITSKTRDDLVRRIAVNFEALCFHVHHEKVRGQWNEMNPPSTGAAAPMVHPRNSDKGRCLLCSWPGDLHRGMQLQS